MLYLPESLVLNQPEKDVNDYVRIDNTSFSIGFTKIQEKMKMEVGERYKDLLTAHLTAISWIEDNTCDYDIIGVPISNQYRERIIKTCTLYIDRCGRILQGFYGELKYYAKLVQKPNGASYDRIEKLIRIERNFKTKFKSEGTLLHDEIINKGIFRIEGFEDFKINLNSDFYKKVKGVSVFNQSSEMNFIYSIAHEEKQYLEFGKNVASLASVPLEIEAGLFVKVLQECVGLVAFLCDLDSAYGLTDSWFKYRGPVVISNVNLAYYETEHYEIRDGSGTKEWGKRKLMANSKLSKQDAIERFINIQSILKENKLIK